MMIKQKIFTMGIVLAMSASTLIIANSAQAADPGANLADTIVKHLKASNNGSESRNTTPIIYGGKDFSHPLVATAHETIWTGTPDLIG